MNCLGGQLKGQGRSSSNGRGTWPGWCTKGSLRGLEGPADFSDEAPERIWMDRNTAQILPLDRGFEQDTGISSPGWGGMPAVLQGHEEGSLWDQGKRGDVSCRGWDVVHCKEHFRVGRLPPRRAPCALNRREVNMGACEREGQRERKTKTERVRGGKEEAGGGGKGRRREGGEETGKPDRETGESLAGRDVL